MGAPSPSLTFTSPLTMKLLAISLIQTVSPCPTDWQSAPYGLRVRSLRNNDEQEAAFL